MTEQSEAGLPKPRWLAKFGWAALGAILMGLVTIVVSVIVEAIQTKKTSLYYAVNPETSPFGGGDTRLAWLMLVNDGDVPVKDWVAEIGFPPDIELSQFGATLGEITENSRSLLSVSSRTILYSTPKDVLNPGEYILVHYVLNREAEPRVLFKCFGVTATKKRLVAGRHSNSGLYIVPRVVALGLFVGVSSMFCVAYLYGKAHAALKRLIRKGRA